MKRVEIARYGAPHEVVLCVEVDEPPPPASREIVIEIDASPIHPADLLSLMGEYATPPPLPLVPGGEATGRVVAVGNNVTRVAVGDRVIPLSRGNWTQRRTVGEDDVIAIPDGDPLQLAMLKVVPATAQLMLTRVVRLAPGEALIQNAANSSVGLALARLATDSGVTAVNVVRRQELVAALERNNAGPVILDGPNLDRRVHELLGEAPVRLAIDAVAGEACLRLSRCLAPGGTVVSYGRLSGEPCMIDPRRTIFEGITLTGFWLTKVIATTPRPELEALYAGLAPLVLDGTIHAPIEATYRLDEIAEAVGRAARFRRAGKIMLTPNAPA